MTNQNEVVAQNKEKEAIQKKYADVIDKDLALMTDKEFKRWIKYMDEMNELNKEKADE